MTPGSSVHLETWNVGLNTALLLPITHHHACSGSALKMPMSYCLSSGECAMGETERVPWQSGGLPSRGWGLPAGTLIAQSLLVLCVVTECPARDWLCTLPALVAAELWGGVGVLGGASL